MGGIVKAIRQHGLGIEEKPAVAAVSDLHIQLYCHYIMKGLSLAGPIRYGGNAELFRLAGTTRLRTGKNHRTGAELTLSQYPTGPVIEPGERCAVGLSYSAYLFSARPDRLCGE